MIPAGTHVEDMERPYPKASSKAAINVLTCFRRQLSNEEDPPEGPPQVAADAPPPYSSLTVDSDGESLLIHMCCSGVLPINMAGSKSILKSKIIH